MIDFRYDPKGQKNITRRRFIRNALLGVGALTLSSWGIFSLFKRGGGKTTNPPGVSNEAAPPPRTGSIATGPKVQLASQSIDSAGGYVAVSKPGDPQDGFVIHVPADSFAGSTTFKVSTAPITSHVFGDDINPVSPMISVDNGGAASSTMMFVRVPVNVPAGSFAMGFIYDDKTGQLEGMPLLSTDAESVTVGTLHFSNFFVSAITTELLKQDLDSGFRPGKDDWEFTNRGSYITFGNCEGQSLTAMWYYYTRPDGAGARLFGRYDNNGNQPATPNLDEDDSLGYRLVSMIQTDIPAGFVSSFWWNLGGKGFALKNNQWVMVDVAGIGDEAAWDLFAYSMKATNQPQLVVMFTKDALGHAMIVYRISNGDLCVADPNYPGIPDRIIKYANGKFQPYKSGANAEEIAKGNAYTFPTIQYWAASTRLPWSTLAGRWAELKNKTIGNGKFPAYQLRYMNDEKKPAPLVDGMQTPYDAIYFGAVPAVAGVSLGIDVWRDNVTLPFDNKGNYSLNPGNNKLGVEISGKIAQTAPDGTVVEGWKYIDFQYINIISNTTQLPSYAATFSLDLKGTFKYTGESFSGQHDNPEDTQFSAPWIRIAEGHGTAASIPITVSGTSFSGSLSSPYSDPNYGTITSEEQISGSFSGDGNTLLTLNYTYKYNYLPASPEFDPTDAIDFSLGLSNVAWIKAEDGGYWIMDGRPKSVVSSIAYSETSTFKETTKTRSLVSVESATVNLDLWINKTA